jgi:predicted hotdog family 3-hydroxylacyl-ACP dehydratase
MNKALVSKETIFEYIPQRDPICLVHAIYECTEEMVKTGFMVEKDHFFVRDGKLMEAGVVENLAQSCAAQAGYVTHKFGLAPKLGFIANIKDLKVFFLPEVGSEIITEIRKKTQVMNVTLVSAHSSCKGQPVAACEMKIFLQE